MNMVRVYNLDAMNEYNRHDYAGRPTRSALVGVGLALLITVGLWLLAGAVCFATLDTFARMGL